MNASPFPAALTVAHVVNESTFIFLLCNHTWPQTREHSFCLSFSTNIPLTSIFLKGKKVIISPLEKQPSVEADLAFCLSSCASGWANQDLPETHTRWSEEVQVWLERHPKEEAEKAGRLAQHSVCLSAACSVHKHQTHQNSKKMSAWLHGLQWRVAVSHTKLLAQENFVPNFSFLCPISWISTWRCLSSLGSDLFPRRLPGISDC